MATIDLAGLFGDIERYAQRMAQESTAATNAAGLFLQDRPQQRARENEHWVHLADDIHVWSQDGNLVIGVNNQERVSQAMLVEYGDEVTPPSPLFRTAAPDVQLAEDLVSEHMTRAFGRQR